MTAGSARRARSAGPGGSGGSARRDTAAGVSSALPETAGDLAGALDLLLADGALGVLRRFRPDGATLRLAIGLARRPQRVASQAALLGSELARIAAGRSQLAPERRDRRFADPAWTQNPLLKRSMQGYLASAHAAEQLLAATDLDWRDGERLRFVLSNLIAAAAPSNNPLLNPAGLKTLIDTGGLSAVRGLRALVTDLAAAPRVPSMVEPGAFEVGKDLAVTPGSVVHRTEMFELIQYAPTTEQVSKYPLLIVPPMINKYYITDLAPGRSMTEYLVSQGHQVFTISWRNPDYRHKDWNLDSYGAAVVDALNAVRAVSGAAKASICALCSGGIVSSMVAAYLSSFAQLDTLASLCLGVTVLDQDRAGTAGAMIDEATAAAAMAASRARGYLDGRTLAEVFAWLRPDDLIWNYWVNNYLQGRPPPAFDILYWNADTTRLPAALHHDFIELALANALVTPDAATMLGSPVDLSKVDSDAYVIAGIADHLCPWQSCYRTTQLLGGQVTFVLSTSGHIASMVNPPDNPKATFQVAAAAARGGRPPAAPRGGNPADPAQWQAEATAVSGSWWPHYSSWLTARSGGTKKSKAKAGSKDFPVLCAAPGTYVHDH
jgi:polyhydroxyalkanoate synthase subunit PhaC